MKFRFSIGRRIGLGFATFMLLTVVAFVLTVITVNESRRRTATVVEQVTPSVAELKELNLLLQRSHTNISKWFYNKSFNDLEFRQELENIIKVEYPNKKKILQEFSKGWSAEEKTQLRIIFQRIETLFMVYRGDIMEQLTSTESYEDPNIYLLARIPFEDSEVNIRTIYKNLNALIASKQAFAKNQVEQMFSSLDFLKRFVQTLGFTLVIGGILIGILTTRSITKPIQILKKML